MCEQGQRKIITGVYGGSFNPIHIGHTAMACELIRRGMVDEVWLVVSPQNPLKNDVSLWDENQRLSLARTAVSHIPRVEVCDVEFEMPRPSYMSSTLRTLSDRYPGREFVLIIGRDNWDIIEKWHDWQWILGNHRVIVLPRTTVYGLSDGGVTDPADNPTVLYPFDDAASEFKLVDMSSSWIRQQIIGNPGYDGRGLDPEVWNKIIGE